MTAVTVSSRVQRFRAIRHARNYSSLGENAVYYGTCEKIRRNFNLKDVGARSKLDEFDESEESVFIRNNVIKFYLKKRSTPE